MEQIAAVFAQNLKKRRRELKMTQAVLGERIGYTEKAVSKWESGSAVPSVEVMVRLAQILGTDVNSLLGYHLEPSFYLGIDGGATKTAFALSDEAGRVVRTLELGPCNPFDMGMNAAQAVLEKGIKEICDGIPIRKVSLFAGISGGGSGGNKEILAEFFEKFGFSRVQNDSDAENAVAVGLSGENGIAVIIGTGSIVYVSDGAVRHRVGGYGYLFDNAGSGFELGRNAILSALFSNDQSGEATMLSELVQKKLGATPLEKLSDIYLYGKPFIASFAPLVFEAASAGDGVAKKILETCYGALARQIRAGRKKMTGKEKVKVALVGGLTRYEAVIRPILETALKGDAVTLDFCRRAPVEGALFLAGSPAQKAGN